MTCPPVKVHAATMTAWAELYMACPAHCQCPRCASMDALLHEIATEEDLT